MVDIQKAAGDVAEYLKVSFKNAINIAAVYVHSLTFVILVAKDSFLFLAVLQEFCWKS